MTNLRHVITWLGLQVTVVGGGCHHVAGKHMSSLMAQNCCDFIFTTHQLEQTSVHDDLASRQHHGIWVISHNYYELPIQILHLCCLSHTINPMTVHTLQAVDMCQLTVPLVSSA